MRFALIGFVGAATPALVLYVVGAFKWGWRWPLET